ncbi:hypothetical protein [Mycolicibacterium palauense]|uniref:hypothetical protein n=1 Tax=Mycolicibacterium palauense TaxID=2034511 RepID=UPI0011453440|nr:hypothetical protein [Mycolicibacterium palauense]
MGLSLVDVREWDPGSISEVSTAASVRAAETRWSSRALGAELTAVNWQGHAADAARARMTSIRSDLARHAAECEFVSKLTAQSAAMLTQVKFNLANVASYAAANDLHIDYGSGDVWFDEKPGMTPAQTTQKLQQAQLVSRKLRDVLEDADAIDDHLARGLDNPIAGGPEDDADGTDGPQFVTGGGDERKRASAEAFEEMFGRPPSSDIDWATADALNPESFDPIYQGVPPEIRVVRIRPVPGQGLVRVSQFIEQRDVISGPFKRDFGNNRTADPNFDPENTKVTTYIDYENGIVVMRQNPSVELNPEGGPGQVKVGSPEGRVWQAPDGSVRIQYDAANPFAPGISKNPPGPLGDNAWTVNGDLVFTPQAGGVRVDGTRTDYPSMEVYQDYPDGHTRTVLIDPAQSGRSWGPAANLPFHHDIGLGGEAFRPFNERNDEYDVPGPPKPSTEFGSVSEPPVVPAPPTSGTQV